MKSIKLSGFLLAAALLTFACGKSTDTVEATEAQDAAEATGQTLSLDTDASKVNWRGYKPTGQHFGLIPVTSGQLSVEGDAITGGEFTFDITALEIHDMEEGTENHGKLWNHLQSDDFFDAGNHPQANFVITEIAPYTAEDEIEDQEQFESENTPQSASEIAPDKPTHWISGNLTMRGNTKNITFPASVSLNNGIITAQAGFNINRTDWGLSYGDEASAVDKAKDQFIYNTVSVNFDVKAN
ncbi:YceI family protein [Cyclobacterium jeungdonense]|uniref:YceI family protein n=1 Tax=Cyclobacterium jeungdonense TaxID=708087 RepID=A0ABT8C9Z4_9BACT|nr:YceI family protein [Cyclobacterium jeungdonense]MDN3689321.1 YceI family protein [Cyclobacterium jeungdonense]